MSLAHAERLALADALDDAGPTAPTLCAGWNTRDLAAHVLLRERRPDAAVGIVVKPLAGWTDRVQRGYASSSWPALVRQVRTGPPRWSPFGLPGVDDAANLTEFFVHTEDVRRGRDGWEPRELDPALEDALWRTLRQRARLFYRRVPVGLVLRRSDRTEVAGAGITVKPGRGVVLVGTPGELLLHAFGRGEHARVEKQGDPADVAALDSAPLGV